jgi:hypothetical protein
VPVGMVLRQESEHPPVQQRLHQLP